VTDPFARLTDQIIHFKWIVIGLWVAVIAVAALVLAPRATEVLQGGSLVIPGSESDRANELLRTKLDASSQNTAIVVIQSGDLTVDSAEFKAQVALAAELLGQVKGVHAVRTYYSGGGAAFASRDGHTTLITASLGGDEQAQQAVIPDIRKTLSSVSLQHWVTGFAAVSYDSLGASEEDAHLAELIFLPVLFVLLLLVFRTLPAALIPLALGGLTVVLSQGLLYPLGVLIPTSVFALNTGSMIGLGLCIDYSLIVVTRYREEVLDGQTPHDALLIAMATAGRSITYSGITVILAMSAMTALLWPIVMVRSISLSVALAALIALAFALTLLPASLHLLGRHIESLAVLPRAKRPKPGELGFWYRLSDLIMARPAVWLVAGLAILVVLAAPLRTIVLGGPGIPAGVESSNGADTVSRAFGPGQLAPVQIVILTTSQNGVWTPGVLGAVDDLTTELAADNRVAGVDSLRSALSSQPREAFTNLTPDRLGAAAGSLGNFVNAAGDTTTLFVYSKDREFDASTESLLTDIRDRILPSTTGLKNAHVLAGGETAVFRDYETGLYARFPLIAAVVAALIFVVLMMFFQSVLLPLKAVILNLISIAATFGVLVAVFQYGWGASLLGFTPLDRVSVISPAILYVVLFALSTDYEVFMLSRVKEYYKQTGRNREAVAAGLQHTAGVITAAAIILLGTFGSFAFGKTVVIKELGVGLGVGVFVDSTIVRIILVPATMRLMGAANWWIPGWLKRILPDLHEETGEAIAHGVVEVVEPGEAAAAAPKPQPRYSGTLTLSALPALAPAAASAPAPVGPAQPARLLVQGTWDGPSVINLSPARPLRIGRDVTNELRLIDLHVSRLHARIDFSNGQYFLTDLSYNGVLINGHRAAPAPAMNQLHNGDRIHIRGFRPVSFVFATETIRPATAAAAVEASA
jgi:RND superfamily putative drug exporter